MRTNPMCLLVAYLALSLGIFGCMLAPTVSAPISFISLHADRDAEVHDGHHQRVWPIPGMYDDQLMLRMVTHADTSSPDQPHKHEGKIAKYSCCPGVLSPFLAIRDPLPVFRGQMIAAPLPQTLARVQVDRPPILLSLS